MSRLLHVHVCLSYSRLISLHVVCALNCFLICFIIWFEFSLTWFVPKFLFFSLCSNLCNLDHVLLLSHSSCPPSPRHSLALFRIIFNIDPDSHIEEMQKAEQVMLDSSWSAKITITGMYFLSLSFVFGSFWFFLIIFTHSHLWSSLYNLGHLQTHPTQYINLE